MQSLLKIKNNIKTSVSIIQNFISISCSFLFELKISDKLITNNININPNTKIKYNAS